MVSELLKNLDDYPKTNHLAERDQCLQALRRQVEHLGQREISNLDEEFETPISRFGPERAEEINALVALLKGYLLASAYRHREAATCITLCPYEM